MKTRSLAEKHSAACFLNSLFREWKDHTYDLESSSLVIKLNHDFLILPLESFSLTGKHSYTGTYFFNSEEINFNKLKELLLNHLATIYKTTTAQLSIFNNRIDDSVENIKSSLDLRGQELSSLYESPSMDFNSAEQALIIGHTFHPHPKNRDEMSGSDYIKYAPETGGKFDLEWFFVSPDILYIHNSKNFENKSWNEELFKGREILKGYSVLPVHPWQKDKLLNHPVIKSYIVDKKIIPVDSFQETEKWHPTSSLRSIYNKKSPYMLKFSLSVRLTNSIRHLLPHEVVRGLQVMDVFSTGTGKTFLRKFPDFNILYEPGFMAIKDNHDKIINESIVSLRVNPFLEDAENKIVLATLTQDHPVKGMSLIGSQIHQLAEESNLKTAAFLWLKKYLDVAVKPLLLAQANYGVLLGAHQQNLILEIKNSLPTQAYFRDCQGTGYSNIGFELFAGEVDLMTVENGNILDSKMGNTLFSYYLFINSTFNVISTLAKEAGLPEEEFFKVLRSEMTSWLKEGVRDTSCFDYLLESKTLLQKGNFLCSIINMNENTTENPLGIYNEMANPIYESKLC